MKPRVPTLLLLAAVVLNAAAMDTADLAARLAAGEKITVIDVRSTEFYQRGHIPQAINVPAALCREKQLPPLGRVVVYDQGLGQTNAAFAATVLSQKPGIKAEVLQGGFAAWSTVQRETTARRGAAREEVPYITYQTLKSSTAADIMLVDLRAEDQPKAVKSAVSPAALTDLGAEFPKVPVTRSPFEIVRRVKADSSTPPLLVLIDRGNGKAEEMARTLRANGMMRFVILAGGEDIIARKGQPGLQRSGSGLTVPEPVISPQPAPAQ